MTGLGSPCGACKFLRRKCAKGCIFAPYFCHEQGPAHFAAIHKVFGASNVAKLLMHLPVGDRCEAAVTISYEAQARLQDPVYGCVAHIFVLQHQVVNLQAQLAILKAKLLQGSPGNTSSIPIPREEKVYSRVSPYQQDDMQGLCFPSVPLASNPVTQGDIMCQNNEVMESIRMTSFQDDHSPNCFDMRNDGISFGTVEGGSSCLMRPPPYHDMEDLQSVALAYLHRA